MSGNIELDHRDSVGIVRLSGEVDITHASGLRDQLLGAVRNEDLGLVVDLTDALYVDSAGVSLLFSWQSASAADSFVSLWWSRRRA